MNENIPTKSVQYWLVGASWGGKEHQDARFTSQGFWMLGWEEGFQPDRASEMRQGDRIAIKRMRGKGKTGLTIKAIGIIQGVIHDANRIICTVDWCVDGMNRTIAESKGCFQSIHGPFMMSQDSEWLKEIFAL